MKRSKLAIAGIIKTLSGFIAMGALLFPSAGTVHFIGAWRMMALLFAPTLVLGAVMLWKAPKLLEKRLNTNESERAQGKVILASALMFISSFVLCGLDFRFGWTRLPSWLVIVGCAVFLATYAGFAELLRENEFLSRTVEVQQDQKVISTGLYGIVRHPMYTIITFMFLSMPVIIGSAVGLLPLLVLPAVLFFRIRNEEKVLEEGLAGYREYKEKVRFRMIPFVW